MSSSIGSVSIDLEARIARFESDMGRAVRVAEQRMAQMQRTIQSSAAAMEKRFASMTTSFANMLKGLGGALTVRAFVQWTNAAIEMGDQVNKLSEQFGVSTLALSKFGYAARQNGSDLQTAAAGLGAFSKVIASAAGGGEKASAAFAAIGVSVRDASGKIKSVETLLGEVATKFRGYEDGAAKAALSMEFFGKTGRELIPTLNQGAKGLDEFGKRATYLGVAISKETADRFTRLGDAMSDLAETSMGTAIAMADELAPSLTAAAESATAFFADIDFEAATRALIDGTREAVQWLDELAVVVGVRMAATAIPAAIAGIGTMVAALGAATTTAAGLGAVIATLGGVGGLIGLAAGAIYYLATRETELEKASDAAREAIERLDRATGNAVQPALDMAEAERERAAATLDAAKASLTALAAQLRLQESMPNTGDFADRRSQGMAVGLTAERIAEARAGIADLTKQIESLDQAMEDATIEKALADSMKFLEDAARRAAPVIDRTGEAQKAAAEAARLATQEWEAQLRTMEGVTQANLAAEESAKRLTFEHEEFLRGVKEEIRLMGLDEETRKTLIRQLDAEARIRQLLEDVRRSSAKLSPEKLATMEQEIRLGAEWLDQADKQLAAIEAQTAAAEPFRQEMVGAVQSITQAFGDFAARGFRGFSGMLDSMKQALQRWIANVIAMLAQRALTNAFAGASGGWAQAFSSALGSGSGSGTGFNVGNLFGGFGSGTNAYSTVTGNVNPFANAYSGTGPLASGYGTSGNPFTSSTGGRFGGAAMGAGLAAAGAYFSGWVGDTSTGRSTLGGAAAGAAYGTMILPGIGTIVGAILGAVIGFISQQDPALGVATSGSDISEGKIEGTATSPFGTINVGKEDFDFDAQKFADQIAEFDKALADIMTSTEVAGVRAALANWEVHQEGADNVNPQAIFESRFNVVLGQFDPAIQAFARAGTTLEDKVERFGQALGVSRIFEDLGLDIDFAAFLDLAREAQIAGEEFGETVSRLAGATHLLGDVFDQLGIDVGDYGATFIKFAADVAEAMGGIEAAGKAWSTIMSAYYSPTERSLIAMDDARDTATAELADVGLDPTISKERFRELFEEMLRGTPTPEQIAEWVQAGVALAAFTDATDAYNATLTETTRVAEAAAQAGAAYGFAIADLQNELLQLSTGFAPSQFVRDLAGIRAEEAARALELNRLAIAAGEAAAAESDLALVHQISAVKAAQAIARLRAAAQSLVNQLYGPGAGRMSDSSATSAISSLDNTAGDLFRSWEDALKNIRKFLDDILLDEGLTTLTPQQQLTEAQAQFADLLARAQAGDVDAAAALPAMARELLENARDFWASGDAYDAIFRSVMEGLAGITAPAGIGTGTPGGVDATLETTIAESEAAAEEVRQQRLLMAVELAGYLRDLGEALGQSVFDLAEEMGIKLETFVVDLGIDLTQLSTETATQLAAVANTLGVELSDLTSELGISLGSLRDTNSFLNNALEGAINAQPPEIRSELGPFLTAIETAATEADANAAIADLEARVKEIGGGTALALAPYLANVDPPSMQDQLDMLDRIGDAASEYLPAINAWLQQIATNTGAEVPIDVDGSFDSGTAYVPYDQVALVHEGEKIIDADTSAALSRYGIKVHGGQEEDRGDIKLLLRENLRESKAAREQQQRNERAIISALERIAAGNGKRGG